jgi:hypothetical protein
MRAWRYTSRISPVAPFIQDAAPSPNPHHSTGLCPTLNQLVRQVTWELTRYGGVDEEALSELLPAEPAPPPSVAVRGLGRQPQHVEGDAEVDALEREYRAAVADFYDGRRRHYRRSQR